MKKTRVRPSELALGDYVLHSFGGEPVVCEVVGKGSGVSGTDIHVEAKDKPWLAKQSYYPFRENQYLTKVTL